MGILEWVFVAATVVLLIWAGYDYYKAYKWYHSLSDTISEFLLGAVVIILLSTGAYFWLDKAIGAIL